jgi:hypothetical protein
VQGRGATLIARGHLRQRFAEGLSGTDQTAAAKPPGMQLQADCAGGERYIGEPAHEAAVDAFGALLARWAARRATSGRDAEREPLVAQHDLLYLEGG